MRRQNVNVVAFGRRCFHRGSCLLGGRVRGPVVAPKNRAHQKSKNRKQKNDIRFFAHCASLVSWTGEPGCLWNGILANGWRAVNRSGRQSACKNRFRLVRLVVFAAASKPGNQTEAAKPSH